MPALENKVIIGTVADISPDGVTIDIGDSAPGFLSINTIKCYGVNTTQFNLGEPVEVFVSGKTVDNTIALSLTSSSDIINATKSRLLYHSVFRDKYFPRRQLIYSENVILLEERRAEMCFYKQPDGLFGVLNRLEKTKPSSFNALLDMCFQPTIEISTNDLKPLQKLMLVNASGGVYDIVYEYIRDVWI